MVTRGARRRLAYALIGLALGLSAAPALNAEPAGCSTAVAITPERPVAGEAIHYALRVAFEGGARALRWEREPRFPGLRVERLPGRADDNGRSVERVLFALEAGLYELPAAVLRCEDVSLADASASASTRRKTQARTLEVLPLPTSPPAPAGFAGLVAQKLSLRWTTPAQRVTLGEAASVALEILSDGNLWVAMRPQIDVRLSSGAEVEAFEEAASDLERRMSSQGLQFRREYRWSLVPRAKGQLAIGAASIVYFDPTTKRYISARSLPIEIEVESEDAAQRTRARSSPSR